MDVHADGMEGAICQAELGFLVGAVCPLVSDLQSHDLLGCVSMYRDQLRL